jgi:hypothetical protein
MPQIVIKGQIKDKKKVHAYAHFLCKELGINRMYSKVIFITFKTTLDHDSQGLCWGDPKEGYVDMSIARKSQGEKLPYEEIMQTLAHEMVHAKQYLRGELCGYSMSWKGKKPRNYSYDNAPWEREAYKREEELYKRCYI